MYVSEKEWMRRRRREREIARARYMLVYSAWVLGIMLLGLLYVFTTVDL
jgi:hypothetical protein